MKNIKLLADSFSYLVLLTLVILSTIHFKERIIHLDSAGFVFDMINHPFEIFSYRISSWFPLLVISLLSVLKSPIESILICTSVAYALFPLITFLLVRYVYQITFHAILIPIVATIGCFSTFYYPVTEVFFGMYLFALIFLVEYHKKWKGIDRLLCFSLLPMTHPFLIPLGVGLILNQMIINRAIQKNAWAFLVGMCFAFMFSSSSSETVFYAELLSFQDRLFFWSTPPFEFLQGHLGKYSWKYLVLLVFVVGWLALSVSKFAKSVKQTCWMLLASLTYFLLVGIVYFEGESALILEKSILPFALLAGCAVVVLLPKKWWSIVVVFVLLVVQIREIAMQIKSQHKRINAIEQLVEKARTTGTQKYLIRNNQIPPEIQIPWALSIETLLYSSIDGGEQVTICPSFEGANLEEMDGTEKVFLYPFHIEMDQQELNQNYFQIVGSYTVIE